MAVNKRLLQGAAAAPGGITPSEHFGVVLYEGDGSTSHSINGGKFGAGGYFNGSSGYISGLPILTNTAVGFSISMWVKASEVPSVQYTILGGVNEEGSTDSVIAFKILSSGDFNFYARGNSGSLQTISTGSNNCDSNWHHLVGTISLTQQKFYVDGTLIGTNTISNNITADNLVFGAENTRGTIQQYFPGLIDQTRIFAKELSSSEVSTLYAETVDTVESLDPLSEDTTDTLQVLGDSSCIATYRFENNEDDESGNYDGTGTEIQYAAGRYGQAASFNGSSSWIKTTYQQPAISQYSVSLWFNTSTTSTRMVLFGDSSASLGDVSTRTSLGIRETGYFTFGMGNGTSSWYDITSVSASSYLDGNWHHAVLVINGTSIKLYVDNSLIGNLTSSVSAGTAATNYFSIGQGYDSASASSRYFNGKIDQVRIFNKAISASEVTTLYNENSLVASYRFEGNANDDKRTYDGTASNVTYEYGLNFTPDFVWVKSRNITYAGNITDSTRGTTKQLYTTGSNAEQTNSTFVTSFDTGGFTVGNNAYVNINGYNFVAWCLKANGGTTSTNTDGSITSTVQANQDAGFSIVTWTGDGNVSTVGHGLSQVPEMVITKGRANLATYNQWATYHHSLAENHVLFLNFTDASASAGVDKYFDDSTFSNTVFGVGDDQYGPNVNGTTMVAYCFHSVEGFSKFGTYTGNGSTNIIETGFEPAFLILKKTNNTGSWTIYDNKRDLVNPREKYLRANLNNAEGTAQNAVDFNSNGFTLKTTSTNDNGDTFVYMAFAADPDTEAPTVAKSFSTAAYTGNGGTQDIDVGFKPGLIWFKNRNNSSNSTFDHSLFDVLRDKYRVRSNSTGAQNDYSSHFGGINDYGATVASGLALNDTAGNYVAWAWKADDNEPTIYGGPAVAVYKFEDNANDVTGSFNATASNVSYVTGYFNKAAEFNGSNSTMFLASSGNSLVNYDSDFSVSLWFNVSSWATSVSTDFLWTGGGTRIINITLKGSNGLDVDIWNSGSNLVSTTGLSENTWYHLVFTRSKASGMKLYINGSVVDTNSYTGNAASLSGKQDSIGTYWDNTRNNFTGKIDQFRIYQGVLAQEQVTELYNETASDNDDLTLGAPAETIISANANAGFSIVKHTIPSDNTLPIIHGLSQAPEMIFIKATDNTGSWLVYHSSVGFNKYLVLNSTAAEAAYTGIWANVNSSTFTTVYHSTAGSPTRDIIAYCFHSVAGYSKIGSYSGTGSAGNAQNVGFTPDWLMVKRYVGSASQWIIIDSVRGTKALYADLSNAESSESRIFLNSTGFEFTGSAFNESSTEWIYMAFKIN